MEEFLLARGLQYCRRITRSQVSAKLQGPRRASEGLVKWDHEEDHHILHFTHGRYADEILPGGVIHIQESGNPSENARLVQRMARLTELPRVPALRTVTGSGGAALEFSVTLARHGTKPGWLATLVKLPAKRRVPFANLATEQPAAKRRQGTLACFLEKM